MMCFVYRNNKKHVRNSISFPKLFFDLEISLRVSKKKKTLNSANFTDANLTCVKVRTIRLGLLSLQRQFR